MILSNAAGAALFMSIIRDQKNMVDRIAAISSAKAFKIAERTLNILAKGINGETAVALANIIHKETDVGSVAITDKEKLLAFVGQGSDHHIPGNPDRLAFHRNAAIGENKVIFAAGGKEQYDCPLSTDLSADLRAGGPPPYRQRRDRHDPALRAEEQDTFST